MDKQFGQQSLTSPSVMISVLCTLFSAKLNELTVAITIPLICIVNHDSLWSEMPCPKKVEKMILSIDTLYYHRNSGIGVSKTVGLHYREIDEAAGEMADAMVTQILGGNVRYISGILVGGSDWPIDRIVADLRNNIANCIPKGLYVISNNTTGNISVIDDNGLQDNGSVAWNVGEKSIVLASFTYVLCDLNVPRAL